MKKAFYISLLFNILIISFIIGKRFYYTQPVVSNQTDWSEAWNQQKNDLFSAAPINRGDIVFIGDSHTDRFLLNDLYPCRKIRNRGIGSNTTIQVLSRLDDIMKAKPEKIFLQIGVNDLAFGYSPDSTFNNIIKIAERIKGNATLYITSVFPTRSSGGYLNNAIKILNEKIAGYCSANGITYINLYPKLILKGELNKEYTIDNSHLNAKGYTIWRQTIEPYLK